MEIVDRDRSAGLGEDRGDAGPDPLSGSGDEGASSTQVEHAAPSSLSVPVRSVSSAVHREANSRYRPARRPSSQWSRTVQRVARVVSGAGRVRHRVFGPSAR